VDVETTLVEAIAGELEAFLRETFRIPRDDPYFSRTVHLWEQGYVDSTGVVETVAYLERRYGIELPEELVHLPAFTHVDGMAGIIAGILKADEPK
jgi:acyl carrier protein